MGKGRFDHVVVAVADEADAAATADALNHHLDADRFTVVYVVEKAGGAPDKAGVEQRERAAMDAFDAFRETLDIVVDIDTDIVYHTDVSEGLIRAAREVDSDAIAFTPRGSGWFERVLTGDVTRGLIDATDRPVVVVPAVEP